MATSKRSSSQQLGRSRRTTSCVASLRSSYFPCCFIHIVERSSRNTLTRDLVGSSSATCSASYDSELNSVDCTPPGGCRTDILSKYAGPDMLGDWWQESPQPTLTAARMRRPQWARPPRAHSDTHSVQLPPPRRDQPQAQRRTARGRRHTPTAAHGRPTGPREAAAPHMPISRAVSRAGSSTTPTPATLTCWRRWRCCPPRRMRDGRSVPSSSAAAPAR